MQTQREIMAMLGERGLSPAKSLGQNFLVDQNLIRRLVDEAGVGVGDLVLEIGPGTGAMTEALLERGCRVVASELDRGLADLLRDRLGSDERFRLVEGDCLESKHAIAPAVLETLGDEAFTLVSNLPYQAGTPAMLALLTQHERCRGLAVTVQKEVAERMVASPGTKAYGTLGVVAQGMASPRVIATLGPACFWPRPKVTSAMVVAPRRADPVAPVGEGAVAFASFCTRLFSLRRKQLGGAWKMLGLSPEALPAGVDPVVRVEALGPEAIASLARAANAGGAR
ncbi:MAG: ribosomal RNA small subunit methyltransferase A [Phycisphaerales bacterium]|nr:MAG: ribosomal RNA small subunit methyltransferase A [Phycisphaerales bacterium]